MEFVSSISPSELIGIKLVAESNQFAIYATGLETYLLIQRHESMPWTGVLISGDALFRISDLLSAATRDLYRELAASLSPANQEAAPFASRQSESPSPQRVRATERRDLYQDDLTEERQISPILRDIVAATLMLDPIAPDDDPRRP